MGLLKPLSENYKLIPNSDLTAACNAIRDRDGIQGAIVSGDMAPRIRAIPNRYLASDEGKVVQNSALVSQTPTSISANGRYDTTTINLCDVTNCYENYTSFQDLQTIVKNGNGPRRFPLYSVIPIGPGQYAQVISHDTDQDLDDPNAHTMTLLALNGRRKHEFDARQKFVIVLSELPTGQYSYKVGDNAWRTITLRSITPSGGYIVFTGDDHTNVATYDQNGSQIETDSATAWVTSNRFENLNGSTVLTNGLSEEGYNRALYGGNCYLRSAARLYLTGSPSNWLSNMTGPAYKWSLPPSYASEAGYQSLLDPGFISILKRVSLVCANTTALVNTYDPDTISGSSYTITSDKIFLPSLTNIGLGQNNGISEGPVWQAFDPNNGFTRGYYDRIRKADDRSSLLNWATRSAVTTTTHKVHEGTQINDTAVEYEANSSSLSLVPAFVI